MASLLERHPLGKRQREILALLMRVGIAMRFDDLASQLADYGLSKRKWRKQETRVAISGLVIRGCVKRRVSRDGTEWYIAMRKDS